MIAFIGPREYSECFAFLGFYCFEAENEAQAAVKIEEARKKNFDLIITSQDILDEEKGIVVLPGILKKERKNYLEEEIKKAVGSEMPISAD